MFVVLTAIFAFFQVSFASVLPTQVMGTDLRSGKKVEVSATNSSPLVVIFLSAHCPCSNSHVSEIQALHEQFPKFRFIGVNSNIDETQAEGEAYFRSKALSFPVIRDDKAKLADAFRASKTPHAFVISSNGLPLYRGGVTDSHAPATAQKKYLRSALQALNAERSVAEPEGRTLGCQIARP